MAIELFYSPGSCSMAVHIVLNEIGVPFQLHKFATAERANYSDEYLAINPKARIPALKIDGYVLTENPAILAFLGRRFPDAKLYPAAGEAEARCLELLAWSSNTVHLAYAQIFRPERFVADEQGFAAVKQSGHVNYERCLVAIEDRLRYLEYALGDRFSVVDPFWLVFFRWGARAKFGMRDDFPAFTAYAERLCRRPSIQKALDVEGVSIWS